jgi:hypothetical protein
MRFSVLFLLLIGCLAADASAPSKVVIHKPTHKNAAKNRNRPGKGKSKSKSKPSTPLFKPSQAPKKK